MAEVLDAHALMVYLEREEGFEKVKSLFVRSLEDGRPLLLTSVNFGEVLYIVLRERGSAKAEEIERIIQSLPVDIVDVDVEIAREAAQFKARKKMSYADCFAAALAKIHRTELVTGDPEFQEVDGEIAVYWI